MAINEYNLNKPKVYLRYVDDILAAFDIEQDPLNFLSFLNNRHPNIKFTIEKQNNHSIALPSPFHSTSLIICKTLTETLSFLHQQHQMKLPMS